MVYNSADQLTSWPGMHTYTYHSDGSLYQVKDTGESVQRSYTYTPAGLLHTAAYGANSCANYWDSDSNRVGLEIASSTYTFVYDPTAGVPAVLLEKKTGGTSVYYYREPGGSLVARQSGEDWRYYHFDALGSTRLLTNSSETVTDRYTYDAYGSLLSHGCYEGSVSQPYQYVGQLGYYTHYQDSSFACCSWARGSTMRRWGGLGRGIPYRYQRHPTRT